MLLAGIQKNQTVMPPRAKKRAAGMTVWCGLQNSHFRSSWNGSIIINAI